MFPSDARCPTPFGPRAAAILSAMVLVLLALLPAAAPAQVLGTWQTARTEAPDAWTAGGFLILGDPVGIVGQLRTGLDRNWDLGIQLGIPDFTDDAIFGIAGDTKFTIKAETEKFPLDLAGDVAFGYQTNDNFDLVDFDLGLIGSKALKTSGGTAITPYGALIFAIGHANDDTDLDVHVRPGLEWVINPTLNFLGELNLSSRDETLSISGGLMLKL